MQLSRHSVEPAVLDQASYITDQQLIATEHIQRQETVMIIIDMKKTALPDDHELRHRWHRNQGSQFRGWRSERVDETLCQNFGDCYGFVPAHAVFKPT